MTTRYSGLLVTLEHEIREDDLESTMEAIRHIHFVARVEPAPPEGHAISTAKAQLRRELEQKVWNLFKEETS